MRVRVRWERLAFVALVVAGVLALASGCGSQPAAQAESDGNTSVQSGQVTVDITPGMKFDPADLTVKAGTTVTWVNHDSGGMVHDVASGVLDQNQLKLDGTFHSPMLSQNQSWSYTFNETGTFPYLCTVPGHAQAGMVATVTVTP